MKKSLNKILVLIKDGNIVAVGVTADDDNVIKYTMFRLLYESFHKNQHHGLCVEYRPVISAGLSGKTHFASCVFSVSGIITLYLYTSIPLRRNVLARICGLCRLILVDILRRVHDVGFLVEQHIYIYIACLHECSNEIYDQVILPE